MSLGLCSLCGKPVERIHDHAFKVTGWEFSRKKGLNRLFDKQRVPDTIAHRVCVEHPRGQESFAA